MENIPELFRYTIDLVRQISLKHEYEHFPSGAIMLHIWYKDKLYVIQFEDSIGVSEVNEENPGFDTIPDERFYTEATYKAKLASILNSREIIIPFRAQQEFTFTPEEQELLQHIYRVRTKTLISVFLFLSLFVGYFLIQPLIEGKGNRRWGYWGGYYIDNTPRATPADLAPYALMLETFAVGLILLIYYRRIFPLKQDLRHNRKEARWYTVTKNVYMEHTGQYFLGLDHPGYLFHEVDRDTWLHFREGNSYPIYYAPHSRYIFNGRGKFTII